MLTGICLLFLLSTVSGQGGNTLYFMTGVPQSYLMNPATRPGCMSFLGLPLVSPLQLNVENSAFSLEDVIFPMGDSLITFLHPAADKEDFLNLLSPVNYIDVNAATNLGSIGYRRGDLYYTFDFTQRLYSRFSYNDDLFYLALNGNERGDRFDFTNTNIETISYFEYAAGVSRILNPKLTIGSRVKLIFGSGNVSTSNKDLTLATDEDWTLNSNMDIRLSLPGLNIPIDENGEFTLDDEVGFDNTISTMDALRSSFGNPGLGVDFGVHYALTEDITLSASILDLAVIRWSANAYTLHQDASFVFSGFEYKPNDTSDMMDNFADSLLSVFRFSVDTDPYYTMLPVKLFIGGTYKIIDQISIGILSRTEYFKNRFREQFTLSANFTPLKIFSATLSYSIMNNTYDNIGLGLSFRLGPFNLYLITDNLATSYVLEPSSKMIIPDQAKAVNFRIGMNLVFGCGKTSRGFKDLPLIY